MDLLEYDWWGGNNPPPENLKTKRQLNDIGLKPLAPVGVICTPKYDCYLYDPNNPKSVKPKRQLSKKQKEALEKLATENKNRQYQKWWENNESQFYFDKCWSEAYCKDWMQRKEGWVILDTETTGLEFAEIVEISIIGRNQEILLNTLVKPTIEIPGATISIHGISNEMVTDSPTLPEIWDKIMSVTKGKELIIYNGDFELSILEYCRNLHALPKLEYKRSTCLMAIYSQWVGDWSNYWEDYKWQPLNGGHRALSDCYAAYELIEKMASIERIPSLPYPQYASADVKERLRDLWDFLGIINAHSSDIGE